MQGDGFVIENFIIKGNKKCYDEKEDNVGELILNALSKTPDCIGEIDALTRKSTTFAEIKEKSVLLATWMRKEGIGSGDVVSICAPRHPDIIIIYYATTFVGATFFPFAFQVDSMSARRQINMLPPQLIFARKEKIGVLEEAATLENHKWKIITFDNDCNYKSLNDVFKTPFSDDIDSFKVSEVNPDNILLLIPTSGTTGTPKFIPVDYRRMMLVICAINTTDKTKSSKIQKVLTYLSPEWRVYYTFPVNCLLNDWTTIFHPEFDCHETLKIIEKYKINYLFFDAYEMLLLNQAAVVNNYDLKSVTVVYSIGAKLFDKVRKKILDIFPNVDYIGTGYSMTETCVVTSFTKNCRNPESEGTVVPNVQVKITDTTTGLPLDHNKVGELCIKSPCVITGYYNNPDADKLAFDKDGWFHTGDEGYYDENGEIVIVGRLKDAISYRSYDIHPSYIEQSLFSHLNIIDAAVVGIKHDLYCEQPVLFVKVTQGSNVTEEDILRLIPKLEYEDTFKDWIIFTDEIPRSANGKILRRILKERAENLFKPQSY